MSTVLQSFSGRVGSYYFREKSLQTVSTVTRSRKESMPFSAAAWQGNRRSGSDMEALEQNTPQIQRDSAQYTGRDHDVSRCFVLCAAIVSQHLAATVGQELFSKNRGIFAYSMKAACVLTGMTNFGSKATKFGSSSHF